MSNLTDAIIAAKLVGGSGGGGGDPLPAVTEADNGNVLTVVEGAWGKAAPSGGGGALIIHFDENTGVCDTTWQDIYDALASGKSVISLYESPGYNVTHTPIYAAVADGQPGGGTKYSLFDTYDVGQATAVASCNSASGYPAVKG